jgi:Domain of unknown function (DUF1929)
MLLALLFAAAPAWGHGGGEVVSRGQEERQLRAYEIETLGPEHAAEHARQREAERDALAAVKAMTPAQRSAFADRQARTGEAVTQAAGPASQVGEWTTAPFPIPNFAIHSAVLPTGKVLFWGYPPADELGSRPNEGLAALWDPSKGTGPASLESVPPPQIDVDGDGDTEAAPIYCSGQSFLPNGALFMTGGNLVFAGVAGDDYTEFAGHNRAFTFDPWSEEWIEQPAMRHGRWYPSQVEMADGRTVILSGYSEEEPGGVYNTELEIFTPSADPRGVGTMQHVSGGDRPLSTYPHLFTLPSGDVAVAGPDRWDTGILDAGALTWSDMAIADQHRDAGTAVLMPGGPQGSSEIVQFGGYDLSDPPNAGNEWEGTNSAEGIDLAGAGPSWSPRQSMNLGRVSHNTVLLPDSSMVTVGGGRAFSDADGSYLTHPDGRLRQVEVYDPATDTWSLGPAQAEDRAYHSTAVLLPDGRVMSAGDDHHPLGAGGAWSTTDTAEIYSPPYLFKGPRPVIASAPRTITPGMDFSISSPSPDIARAVLMAPSATTHGIDMHQRHVELQLKSAAPGSGLTAAAPPSYGVAPPGYYMLFLLNDQGVPSVASWVRVGEPEPEPPADGGDKAKPSFEGPNVKVSLRSAPRSGSGGMFARVHVNEAARVRLSVVVRGSSGRTLGRKRTTLVTDGAETRNVRIKVRRRDGERPRRAAIAVRAEDPQGTVTAWRRTLTLGR